MLVNLILIVSDFFYWLCHNCSSFLYCIIIYVFAVFWCPHFGPFISKTIQGLALFRGFTGTIYHTEFFYWLTISFVYISCFDLVSTTPLLGVVFIWVGICSLFPTETIMVDIWPFSLFKEGFLLTLYKLTLQSTCNQRFLLPSCREPENLIPEDRLVYSQH